MAIHQICVRASELRPSMMLSFVNAEFNYTIGKIVEDKGFLSIYCTSNIRMDIFAPAEMIYVFTEVNQEIAA